MERCFLTILGPFFIVFQIWLEIEVQNLYAYESSRRALAHGTIFVCVAPTFRNLTPVELFFANCTLFGGMSLLFLLTCYKKTTKDTKCPRCQHGEDDEKHLINECGHVERREIQGLTHEDLFVNSEDSQKMKKLALFLAKNELETL